MAYNKHMIKLAIKRLAVSFVIVTLVSLVYSLYSHFNIHSSCSPMGCSDATVDIETYVDLNGNGQKDTNEPALDDVCVWVADQIQEYTPPDIDEICGKPYQHTTGQGKWVGSGYVAGKRCDEVFTYAVPPNGYQPTTPLAVNYCIAKFGFISSGTVPRIQVLSPVEYSRRYISLENLKQAGLVVVVVLGAVIISIVIIRPRKAA